MVYTFHINMLSILAMKSVISKLTHNIPS